MANEKVARILIIILSFVFLQGIKCLLMMSFYFLFVNVSCCSFVERFPVYVREKKRMAATERSLAKNSWNHGSLKRLQLVVGVNLFLKCPRAPVLF